MANSSSSSSSYLDYSASKVIPFYIEQEKINPIWVFAFDNEDVFAGSGSDGLVLKSSDRYLWSKYFQTEDIHVTALNVFNGYLYVGTSPSGYLYKINIETLESESYTLLTGGIVNITIFNDKVFVAANGTPRIYVYNESDNLWSLFYEPYKSITSMEVIHDKLYVTMEAENVIYYDGERWNTLSIPSENTASLRNLSTDVFSNVTYSFINRSTVVSTDGMAEEDIYDIFPQNWNDGVSSVTANGDGLVMGGLQYPRVYGYYEDEYTLMFDTNTTSVKDVLNINKDVNVAAIDNKLYLIYCGNIETTTVVEEEVVVEETVDPNEGKTVVITYPNGGEVLEIGQSITIQWSSTRSINDAVKLELYKEGTFDQTINSNTSNDGQYQWDIPLSLERNTNYQIYIEWLTAGTASESDKDLSDDTFSVVNEVIVTTTTTTEAIPIGAPSTEECRGIPILELPEYEYITKMEKDPYYGGILIATSEGRIIHCDTTKFNAYFTGDRTIYANAMDGMGYSNVATTSLTYALYNKIAEINSDKEIVTYTFAKDASAIKTDDIKAVLIGEPIYVKEDLGLWKELLWSETKLEGTEIVISIRSANSVDELNIAPWKNSFRSLDGEIGIITRDLTEFNIHGSYLQIKVEMKTSKSDVTPSVTDITLKYSTKQATYFYSTKFSLKNDADAKRGLMVANISQPKNTEVKFGVNNTNSNDWNDYQIVDPNKLFELDNWENIKVGIKLMAYDENIPSVSGFALMAGAEQLKVIN